MLLGGELDLYNADEVRTVLADAVDAGTSRIVIDLAEVDFVDSTALGVLLEARLAARRGRTRARRPAARDPPRARGERPRSTSGGPRLDRPGARTLSDDHLQLRVLDALQGAERYNRWLAELTLPYLGEDPIEGGSGIGTNAALWLELGAERVTVSERDEAALVRLRERFVADPRVRIETIDLAHTPRKDHSAFVALNVLEHIEDDRSALRGAAALVRPGGRVVVVVPAFPFAAGRFDRAIGHHHRYTKSTLAAAYEDAGLEVEKLRYVNAPGLPAWFLSVRLLGLAPQDGMLLRLWDRGVVPVARRVERRITPLFGQSLLAVGRTPD